MTRYQEIFQTSISQGSNNPPDPFLYQEDGKTYASLPAEMLRNIQGSHLYEKMEKDCKAKGIELPKNNNGQRPGGAYDDSTGVFAEGGGWPNAANEQSPNDGRISSQE